MGFRSIFFFHDFIAADINDIYSFEDNYASFLKVIGEKFDEYAISARVKEDGIDGFQLAKKNVVRINYNGPLDALKRPLGFVRESYRIGKVSRSYKYLHLSWPHPVSLYLAILHRRRETRISFAVRQNQNQIIKSKYRGLTLIILLALNSLMEVVHLFFFRKRRIFVHSEELFRYYKKWNYKRLRMSRTCLLSEDLVAGSKSVFREKKFNFDAVRLLFVGRLELEKGCDQLVRSIPIMRDSKLRVKLVVVGAGTQLQPLKSLANEICEKGEVQFESYIKFGDDLFELYKTADLLVVPSYTEGFPKVIGEAKMFGLPVIAANVGGIKNEENIVSGIFKISSNEPQCIAEGIVEILGNEDLQKSLAKSAKIKQETGSLEFWTNYVYNEISG